MRPNAESVKKYQEVVTGYEKSGMTVRAYCERERIAEPSFYYYRRYLKALSEKGRKLPGKFRPLNLISSSGGFMPGGYEVKLVSGAVIKIPRDFDAGKIETLLSMLG
jgi:hypothetical protein